VTEQDDGHGDVRPEDAGEHPFPSATIWPVGFAVGIALLLVGLVFSWPVFGIGAGIAILFGVAWARDVVRGPRPPQRIAPPAVETPEEEDEEAERFGRDKFLELSTLGLGALIGGIVTVPVVGFAVAPAFIGQGDEDVDVGPIANFPEGQFVVTTFTSRKREGDVSRQTAYIRNNGFANQVPSFTVISNHCVHLGCPVQPGGPTDTKNPKEIRTDSGAVTLISSQPASFICPCHGGSYDTEGNRTAGPPVRALDRYQYKIVNGSLVLGDRYSVGKVDGTGASAKIYSYTRYDPGEHMNGPDGWMYPVSPRGV
jgi:menaquinol-cytochrome c reductase iron-sulfur subunit